MNNPYQELSEFEPFNIFGLHAMVFEAFKKTACAGQSERVKTESKDIAEAIYTLNRAVDCCHSIEYIDPKFFAWIDPDEVISRYRNVFGESQRLEAAKHILLFCKTNNVGHLKDAIVILESLR